MMKVTIIDGYIDEPTCLGVPPYISPYPRYIAGSILNSDKSAQISYFTIDQLRNDKSLFNILLKSDLIVTVVGMSVPGRYLSGYPASPNELVRFLSDIRKPLKLLCGPAARYGFGIAGGKKTKDISFVEDVFDIIIKGDSEVVISKLINNNLCITNVDTSECRSQASVIREYAIKGLNIINQHPYFPHYLICEIETYRGCSRSIVGGCSFCSEPSKGLPDFRPIQDIIDEIQAMYKSGVRNFRIGNQPCIFSYMAKDSGKQEFPRPNPNALEKLFKGIRKVAPDLNTLHVDNANPGILARFPDECRKIAKTIVKYHTSGDVAALGVESVDPNVMKKNNLKASSEEVLDAIKLLNEIGSNRGSNGMPEFLPGLNFVFGLEGETKKTYQLDYEFLKNILDQNLLLRRINLRQVIPIPNTKIYNIGNKIINKYKAVFQRFKKKVQIDVERPMLKKILPKGTVLRNVFTEMQKGKVTFSRQIGSYPILVGIPGVLVLNNMLDVKVTDYGYRSITAVPYPVDINNADRDTIEALPGIGRKRAIRILANRPFKGKKQFINSLDEVDMGSELLEYLSFKQ
jgi:radical SAM superfamily enzyme with C-terminal helix-hairpin-helix motif